MTWNLEDLKKNIECLYGPEQKKLLAPCLQSIWKRQRYAHYHYQEFQRLLEEFLTNKFDQRKRVRLILGVNEKERGSFLLRQIAAEAHIIGCLQSMHSTSDILSHVIYYSLNMNNDPKLRLEQKSISIQKVLKNIPTEYSLIRCPVEKLVDPNSGYRYLCAIVNHSKHRSVINISPKVNFCNDADRSHGIEFIEFVHDNEKYYSQWVDTYLTNEYGRQHSLIIRIGNELNHLVRNKANFAAENGGLLRL